MDDKDLKINEEAEDFLKNHIQEPKIVNLVWANIFAVLMLIPIAVLYFVPFYLIWGMNFTKDDWFGSKILLLILCCIAGIVIHELIHGIFFAIYAKNGFKSVRFGVMAKMLTPYCHCKEPLKIKHYFVALWMPCLILGVVPAIAAIVFGYYSMLLFAFLFTISACGDILIFWSLRKENKNDYVQDHPSEAGCMVYRKK